MPITNNRLVPVAGTFLLAFTFAVGATPALATPSTSLAVQAQEQPAQAQVARGELVSVNATAKLLTIKTADGAEQRFQYTEQTKVTGEKGGVAGLATMSGRQVVIRFTNQGSDRVATEIEILPVKQ
jgi:YD repeat-containing protein